MNEEMLENLKEKDPGRIDRSLLLDIENIPLKISFKIGEVAHILDIRPHVLRYWEIEFEVFHPKKMSNGQRLYFKKDVETALLIKKLLYRDGFSVKGAQKVLQGLKKENRIVQKQAAQQGRCLKEANAIMKVISQLREMIK